MSFDPQSLTQDVHKAENGTGKTAVPPTHAPDKYQRLFEDSPISLWEEDFSLVKQYLDQLRQKGVTDLKTYFDQNPIEVSHCIELIKITDVNQTTLQLYKAASKEELVQNLPTILGPEVIQLFKEELIFIGNGGNHFESEGRNYTLAGDPLDVFVRWSVAPDYEDTLSQVIVSILDISGRKEAERQTRLQTTALEAAANAIVITDNQGAIQWVNPAFTKLTGYSLEEAVGQTPRILKSGQNDPALYADLWRTITAGQAWHCDELINKRKDGSLYYEQMTITPVKDEAGKITQFIALKEDISERKQTELQIHAAKEYAEQLFRVVPSAILTVDENQIITSWNQKAAELLGYSAEEMIGQPCHKFAKYPCNKMCGLFADRVAKPINGAECQVETKDGRILTVLKNADLLRDSNGRVIGGIESFEDITKQKAIENQLNNSLSMVQATLEATADGILVVSSQGQIMRYNQRLLEMWRVPDALLHSTQDGAIYKFILSQLAEPEQFIAKIQEVTANPTIDTFDVLTFKDGRIFERVSRPQRIDNEIVGRVWSYRDVTAQRQTEQALRLAQFSIDTAPQSIFWIGHGGRIIKASEGASEQLGYTAAELQRMTIFDIDPVFPPARLESLWEEMRQKRSLVLESTHQTKNGRCYPVEIHLSFMEYENQEFVFASAADITERKRMETQLRQQLKEEELLSQITLLAASSENLNDILSRICTRMANFYGVPKSAFALLNSQKTDAEVIVEYCEPGQVSSLGRLIPVANNPSMEFLLNHKAALSVKDVQKDPLLAPVHHIMKELGIVSILLIPILVGDEIVGTMGFDAITAREFSQDEIALGTQVAAQISHALQRQQAEQEIQDERDFALQVMDNMGQGLVVAQTDWTIEYCNPAMAEMLGLDPQDIVGKSALDLVSAPDPRLIKIVRKRWLKGEAQSREIPLQHTSGAIVHTLLSAVPRWRDGQIDGAIAVVTDLTKRKEIEREQSRARDQALEASRLKSEFLANMSHEIRTPLNAITGMTSLLLETDLNEQQRDFSETIQSSSDVLLALINDILDFSKIEAGKLELEERPFDLRDCIEEALDVVVTKAAQKGLEIAYIMEEHVPQIIVGDVTRLRQVLVNLLNNAIKFTTSGEVVLRVSPYHNGHVRPGAHRQMLHFSVRDTGIGIPESRRNRLFQSFSQVDASTTRKYGGTGLGLAISRRLVEMMGGTIWVDSKVNQGSTFHFTIETEERSLHRRVYLRGDQPLLQRKKLLIVDDNETNRFILQQQTQAWGMEVTTAVSGMAALDILRTGQHFDGAILDMQMPHMDGLTLAREIRQLRNEKELPLIMFSSIGDQNGLNNSPLFTAYLSKPLKPKQLFSALTNLFSETAVAAVPKPAKREIDPDMGRKHPLRILLAEDNLVNQKVALRILERMGYQADIVTNGLEVLEALQQQPYDVILMDVQMPNMDGVEATQQIHEIWPLEQQPTIIAMTANALTGDREKYLAAGMDNYISKPIRIQELIDALANSQPLSMKK